VLSKQEQIQATALRLFVADGFHGTPTAKIAAEAGVANGTLFYHYKTKEDLVVSLYNKIQDEHAANVQAIINKDDFISTKFRNIFIHSVNWAMNILSASGAHIARDAGTAYRWLLWIYSRRRRQKIT